LSVSSEMCGVREWNSSLLCWWPCRGYVPHFKHFLGAFTILWKKTVSFVMSVHLSVRPHGTTRIFIKFDIWVFFINMSRKFKFYQNPTIVKRTLHEGQYTLLICLAHILLELEMFQTKVAEKIKTRILYSVTFSFRKPCRLWDNVEKYFRAGHATDGNVAHAHFILDT
jgi:hypothetical protein